VLVAVDQVVTAEELTEAFLITAVVEAVVAAALVIKIITQ
jgi:hypothetical protein